MNNPPTLTKMLKESIEKTIYGIRHASTAEEAAQHGEVLKTLIEAFKVFAQPTLDD